VDSGVPEDRVLVVARGYEAPPGVVAGEIEMARAEAEGPAVIDVQKLEQRLNALRMQYRCTQIVALP